MKREHFLRNVNIAKFTAKLANMSWEHKQEQTLVLIDEVSQIDVIAPFLTVPYVTATGTGDPSEAVKAFNEGKARVLIGTGCISTGTNIFPTHNTVNWQGGSSEIKTKQGAVGRSVRKLDGSKYESLHKPKEKSVIWDFSVQGVPVLEGHLEKRIGFYEDSGMPIRRM
jgi:superfamily II DNA or RNA helicase